ncbi:hypothetical protein [Leuconostoc citreum]|uniref:hypothetical protein n=1 Tax=Leuconostoc citreum TaxID=33964 RepID=UPI001FA89572|nr:hypothetical protein [Leuconostoc citreum]
MKIIQLSNAKAIYLILSRKCVNGIHVLNDQNFKEDYPDEYTLLNNVRFVTLDVSDNKNYGVLDPFIVIDFVIQWDKRSQAKKAKSDGARNF